MLRSIDQRVSQTLKFETSIMYPPQRVPQNDEAEWNSLRGAVGNELEDDLECYGRSQLKGKRDEESGQIYFQKKERDI